MNLLDDLIRWTGTFCRWGVLLTGVFYVLVSVSVAYEVVVRKLFNVSMMGIDEMSGFVLAMGTSWGFAFALLHRGHIRIDSVMLVLPQRARAFLDILGLIMIVGFVGILTWYAKDLLIRSAELGSNALLVDFPLWIPQALWVTGFATFLVLGVLLLLRALIAFFAGDLAKLHALIGSRSVTEEVDREKQAVERYREGPP